MRLKRKQRSGLQLMWAYLAYHAKKCVDREQASWIYLFAWAEAGGKTRDVPVSFGGTAP